MKQHEINGIGRWRIRSSGRDFLYDVTQPHGFFSGQRLSLREVAERIESGEFNGSNVLTVETWVRNVIPHTKEYSNYNENHENDFDKDKKCNNLQQKYPLDFPAWALARHIDGRIFVAAKQSIEGISYIGVLDNSKLMSGNLSIREDLRILYETPYEEDWFHPSENEKKYNLVDTMNLDNKSGLFLASKNTLGGYFPSWQKRALIWNASTEEARPLVIGGPRCVRAGGGEILCQMDCLSDNSRVGETCGIIKGGYL